MLRRGAAPGSAGPKTGVFSAIAATGIMVWLVLTQRQVTKLETELF